MESELDTFVAPAVELSVEPSVTAAAPVEGSVERSVTAAPEGPEEPREPGARSAVAALASAPAGSAAIRAEVRAKLRALPPVHRLLMHEEVLRWLGEHARQEVVASLQAAVDTVRQRVLAGEAEDHAEDALLSIARDHLATLTTRNLREVINATGTVIHTNLGRAPLAQVALDAMCEVARGYSNLEFDLEQGERGHRYSHVEALICELTGAEAALVVNNNAAAVLLTLIELAQGQKVAISRGELVEIGGSFRVSEVMRASGAELVEIGTTNKTHAHDYRRAIEQGARTVLRVHASNFRVIGFTYQLALVDLVTLAHELGAIVIEDLGSGSLLDLQARGVGDEPTVRDSVRAGVDIVMFSGDKLLGAAQAGIICGRAELVARIRTHQVARAVRVDKLTLAALEATLRLYRDEERAVAQIPVLHMLTETSAELSRRAGSLLSQMALRTDGLALCRVLEVSSQVGGGALPSEQLPSFAVGLKPVTCSPDECIRRLRGASPPVVARIAREEVIFDVRTIFPEQHDALVAAVESALLGSA
ncbi:MAG: L-seryl-tRNA(Sec) selenium transferase [Firmicutes bacterium]|nr:L-seryl-tRNA(Sec) selenium transferase [Bacillota bacterium]